MGLGNKREFFFVSLITILATILIARGMTRPFEYDELYTAFFFVDTKSFWETISTYLAFNNHIGFSVIARVFLKLFGKDEWIV